MQYSDVAYEIENSPNEPIIEYKAKVEDEVTKKCEKCDIEYHDEKAKYCSICGNKLVEEPEFKVSDYVTDTSDDDPFICKIEKFVGNDISGKWYCVSKNYFDRLVELPMSSSRLSTPEEIAEYKAALNFHKHGRKPFGVKRGDVVYLKGYDKNIFLDSGNIYKKHNFVDGDVVLVKTAEEVNEWLGVSDE